MQNVKKITYFTLLVSSIILSNSLSAYSHTIMNQYDEKVKITANTILGRNKSITVIPSPDSATLDAGDLCVRGFKVKAYNIEKKKWHRLGYAKTKSVTTDILGNPAIARGCMNYQLTIRKDGTLLLERIGEN